MGGSKPERKIQPTFTLTVKVELPPDVKRNWEFSMLKHIQKTKEAVYEAIERYTGDEARIEIEEDFYQHVPDDTIEERMG